jgi:hypothetical protein
MNTSRRRGKTFRALRGVAPAVLLTLGALTGAAPDARGAQTRTETPVTSTGPVAGVTETMVRVRAPLPASFGARPAACDWLSYLRYRSVDGQRAGSQTRARHASPGCVISTSGSQANSRGPTRSSTNSRRITDSFCPS